MSHDFLHTNPREIKFYGESKADSIQTYLAFVTLRNPNPNYDFGRGENVEANCVDYPCKMPVVCLGNITRPLGELPLTFLVLDGFMSHRDAVNGMRGYPGYEQTSLQSPMQAMVFIHRGGFDNLHSDFLTNTMYKFEATHAPVDQLPSHPSLRHIFLPQMCISFVNNDRKTADWLNFLEKERLLTMAEIRILKMAGAAGEDLRNILETGEDHPFYKPVVLGTAE